MNSRISRLGPVVCLLSLTLLPSLRAGNDYPVALALDNWENAFVTGNSEGFGTAFDFATLKYNAMGNLQWKQRFNGLLSSNDKAYALVVDGPGNVYVTGSSAGLSTGLDYATIKYDCNGNLKWVARFNGTGNGDDIPRSIAVDSMGNVYVTGSSLSSFGGLDFLTIKYNSSGNQVWMARWSGPNGEDIARAIKVDSSGNVYVTGSSTSSFGLDYVTVKYNCNGALLWMARYNGPGNGNDIPVGLAVDSNGNVFVTGTRLDCRPEMITPRLNTTAMACKNGWRASMARSTVTTRPAPLSWTPPAMSSSPVAPTG